MAGKKKVVTLRPKGDRKPKDISEEPEMKRLKKLLDEGKISQDRLDRYLKTGGQKGRLTQYLAFIFALY